LYQCGKKGDVDHNSTVDLKDTILALQIITGMQTLVTPCVEASVNGGKIGLVEALHTLRQVAFE